MSGNNDDLATYETGARKYELRPELKQAGLLETGDAGDRPKKPYGLTESVDEHAGDKLDAPLKSSHQ